ncbi:MAG: TonB-dependent receptor, partial [Vicinamibacteria bacterium]
GPNDLSSRGLTFFVQDTFQYGNLVANLGLRVERWNHFGTTGENVFSFPLTWAPRLSAIYDIKGDGLQKFSVYWGRYYDPIRNNMTAFAGTFTGRVLEEQVWMDAVGEFVNYRTRGGAKQQDAAFAPTTQTPYTDDLTIGYEIDLGQNKSFEFVYTNRRTRDILEDYDLSLYGETVDGTTIYPGPLDDPDSLWLGLDYFGFDENPGSNFIIATLARGKRDGNFLEFNFRKRYSDRWQALASYVYSDADGNTNSDSNADFQGDVLYLDPGAPNQFGTQPGLIRHNLKFAATYQFENGLEFGGFYQWNSGLILSRTRVASRRHLPAQVNLTGEDNFEFAGIPLGDIVWLSPTSVGTVDNPSWGQLDVRVQYTADFGQGMRTQFFVDWFNVTNGQGARKLQDVTTGQGGIAEGDPLQWVNPTRLFLGVRFMF